VNLDIVKRRDLSSRAQMNVSGAEGPAAGRHVRDCSFQAGSTISAEKGRPRSHVRRQA